jgi:hypothetical protein
MKTSLIGISGKIGHGKDLLAKIIQIMTDHDKLTDVQVKIIIDAGYPFSEGYQIKKFAGKLKECAALLTGIPIQKFEDQDFKLTNLGPEWNYWEIAVMSEGKIMLHTGRHLTKESAEESIEHVLKPMYGEFDMEYEPIEKQMTVRQFLQEIGTDAIRNHLHPNAWVNALLAGYSTDKKQIITDVRFPNEFNAIRAKKGLLVRITRPMMPDNTHISETALDKGYDFDVYIDNTKDVKYLAAQVREKILPLINY